MLKHQWIENFQIIKQPYQIVEISKLIMCLPVKTQDNLALDLPSCRMLAVLLQIRQTAQLEHMYRIRIWLLMDLDMVTMLRQCHEQICRCNKIIGHSQRKHVSPISRILWGHALCLSHRQVTQVIWAKSEMQGLVEDSCQKMSQRELHSRKHKVGLWEMTNLNHSKPPHKSVKGQSMPSKTITSLVITLP